MSVEAGEWVTTDGRCRQVAAGAANGGWRVNGGAWADGWLAAIGDRWCLLVVMQDRQHPRGGDLTYAYGGGKRGRHFWGGAVERGTALWHGSLPSRYTNQSGRRAQALVNGSVGKRCHGAGLLNG